MPAYRGLVDSGYSALADRIFAQDFRSRAAGPDHGRFTKGGYSLHTAIGTGRGAIRRYEYGGRLRGSRPARRRARKRTHRIYRLRSWRPLPIQRPVWVGAAALTGNAVTCF